MHNFGVIFPVPPELRSRMGGELPDEFEFEPQ